MSKEPPDELEGTEAPFVSHLIELRDRLVRALIAVGVAFGVLAFWPGPAGLYDLMAAPLVATLPQGATMIATNVISPFLVPLKITLMAAFMLALPIVLYQVWAFVAPGLYSHEKKLVLPLVVSSTLLFVAGVAFCYFFVFGQVFKFIQGFAPKSITAAPDIEAYLGFVLTMFIAFGAAFEVPVVVVVLARMGGHHPTGHRLAIGAGNSDVPAVRSGHPFGRNVHQAHPGARRGALKRTHERARPIRAGVRPWNVVRQ